MPSWKKVRGGACAQREYKHIRRDMCWEWRIILKEKKFLVRKKNHKAFSLKEDVILI